MKNKLKTCLNVIISFVFYYVTHSIFMILILLLNSFIHFEISTIVTLSFASFISSVILSIVAFFIIRKKWLVPDKSQSKPIKSKKGYVYVLSNTRAFGENVFKIGFTTEENKKDRLKSLKSTSMPYEFFDCAWIAATNARELENYIHDLLSDFRMDDKREFFCISLQQIIDILGKTIDLSNVEFRYEPSYE